MVKGGKFKNRLIVTNFSGQTNCLQSICVAFEHYVTYEDFRRLRLKINLCKINANYITIFFHYYNLE